MCINVILLHHSIFDFPKGASCKKCHSSIPRGDHLISMTSCHYYMCPPAIEVKAIIRLLLSHHCLHQGIIYLIIWLSMLTLSSVLSNVGYNIIIGLPFIRCNLHFVSIYSIYSDKCVSSITIKMNDSSLFAYVPPHRPITKDNVGWLSIQYLKLKR